MALPSAAHIVLLRLQRLESHFHRVFTFFPFWISAWVASWSLSRVRVHLSRDYPYSTQLPKAAARSRMYPVGSHQAPTGRDIAVRVIRPIFFPSR